MILFCFFFTRPPSPNAYTKSTIITTNKTIEEWNDIFDEQVLTRAIVDRIMHHASIVSINGKSFRMKTKNKTKKEVT